MLFVYGRILSQRLVNTVTSDKFLYKLVSRFIKYHMVTCYFLYITGLYGLFYSTHSMLQCRQSLFHLTTPKAYQITNCSVYCSLFFHNMNDFVILTAGLLPFPLVEFYCFPSHLKSGFMWFILTLKKKRYKYQFGQYAWTHMILIVVFTQSSFTVANIFEGIFW